MEKKFSNQFITRVALMSVISFVLIIINFPLPIFPTFLKIDLSDVPSLITTMIMGPIAGILVQLIKNLLHFLINSSSGGIGEIANFFIGLSLILPVTFIYKLKTTKSGYIIGGVVGVLFMTFVGVVINYYVLLPMYIKFMGMESIIQSGTEVNGYIVDMKSFLLFAIAPFNIVKGTITVIVSGVLYNYIKPIFNISV